MNSDISRLIKNHGETAFIIAVVFAILCGLFVAVTSSVPPEPTPESVEMGALQ